MRAFTLVFSVVFTLFGVLKLYHAFQTHGDFDAYAGSVLFAMLGIVMFWNAYSRRNDKREL